MEWISIKERLPNNCEKCSLKVNDGRIYDEVIFWEFPDCGFVDWGKTYDWFVVEDAEAWKPKKK